MLCSFFNRYWVIYISKGGLDESSPYRRKIIPIQKKGDKVFLGDKEANRTI